MLRTIRHPTTLRQLVLSGDSRRLIALDSLGIVWFSDPVANTSSGSLEHPEADSPLALSPSGTLLAVARDAAVAIQGTDPTRKVYATLLHKPIDEPPRRTAGERQVRAAEFSPDGRILATLSSDGTVRIWNAATWVLVRSLLVEGVVNGVDFSADSRRLLTSATRWPAERGKGTTSLVAIWDVDSGERLAEVELPSSVGLSTLTAISAAGNNFAAFTFRDEGPSVLFIWAVAGSRQMARIGYPSEPSSIAFSPNERLLAVGRKDHSVGLLDIRSGKQERAIVHEDCS